jgi:TatA/E family protein of Tat protein translocase
MMNVLAFGPLGGPEIAVIFVVVLLLFGAKKIPELARGLGKSMGEFKRARDEFEDEIRTAEVEVKTAKKQEVRKEEKETSEVS